MSVEAHAARLFGSSEQESTDLSPFKKWTGMLSRNSAHNKKAESDCAKNPNCAKIKWENFANEIQSLSDEEKIRKVNRFVNTTPYIEDMVNWGKPDYWETFREFTKRYGDCEDYAINKYFLLRRVGMDPHHMRIVVLKDRNLNAMHSVLAVYEGDKIYILDNQIPDAMEDSDIRHYTPFYSINEYAWWRHMP